jgi:hypothetical protein
LFKIEIKKNILFDPMTGKKLIKGHIPSCWTSFYKYLDVYSLQHVVEFVIHVFFRWKDTYATFWPRKCVTTVITICTTI